MWCTCAGLGVAYGDNHDICFSSYLAATVYKGLLKGYITYLSGGGGEWVCLPFGCEDGLKRVRFVAMLGTNELLRLYGGGAPRKGCLCCGYGRGGGGLGDGMTATCW